MGRFVGWMFRSRIDGKITIAQFPNMALWIVIWSAMLQIALRGALGNDAAVLTWIGWVTLAAKVWWAVDEVVRGVNPGRRLLGVGVLVLTAATVSK